MPDGRLRTILIVEDDEQTREYFAAALTTDPATGRVLKAANVDEARAHLAAVNPEVMLVDIGLPDGSGIDLIRHVRAHSRGTVSMVISVFGDEASIIGALEAGARGYLLKSEAPEDLRLSVTQLCDGGAPISPAIASHLLRRFSESGDPHDNAHAGTDDGSRKDHVGLTQREREALLLIVQGLSYQQVANEMGITRHTATSHIRSIYRKLEVRSRSEAVYEALSLGIVKVDERS